MRNSGNPNLTSGEMLPGYYGYIDYNSQGGAEDPNRRAVLFGYVGPAAQRTPNRPFSPASQQDADNGCQAGSDLARAYAAAVSQPESQGAEIWLVPIREPAGGNASRYRIRVFVANDSPAKPGTVQLWIASQQLPSIGFSTSDTAPTIAAAIGGAIQTMTGLPIGSVKVEGDTIEIVYLHKGQTGEDFPIRCNISPDQSGVNLSPGQLRLATSATVPGSVVVSVGALSISTVLAAADSEQQAATKVAASFAADTYPLTAAVDAKATNQVNLFFANDFDVRRVSASVIGATGMTADLGSGKTDGSGSATSQTYNGVLGTGIPSLTIALANLQSSSKWYRSWSIPWTDALTLGAVAHFIENGSNGSITGQKLQTLTVCDFRALSVVGAIPPSVSPNLTTTPPHYAFGWSPDCAVQAFELAARVAVARAGKWIDTPQFNWNGFRLQGNSKAPILAPAKTPDEMVLNAAVRTYALSPWVLGASGNLEVVKGRTTSLSNDLRLWAWSSEAQAAYHIVDLKAVFAERFTGCSIVRYSEPKADRIVDVKSFEDTTRECMDRWGREGNYDGAKRFASAVRAVPHRVNPFRGDVDFPESPVLDLDQIVFASHFSQPSQ